MGKTQLDALAGELDELRSSLKEHIDAAAGLLGEAEATERLRSTHRAQVARIDSLLANTRALRTAVQRQQTILHELRARMAWLLKSQS
jgi:hypothetical protein